MSRMSPVTVQLTEEERRRLSEEAAAAGISLSALVRNRLQMATQVPFVSFPNSGGPAWSATVQSDAGTWTYNFSSNTSAPERRETK